MGSPDDSAVTGQPASLGTAMSSMAEAIGSMVAGQQRAWEEEQERRRRRLRRRCGGSTGGKGASDGAGGAGGGTWLDISPEAAVPIPYTPKPRRIAYVDGGNAVLLGSPGWSIGFNRVAYTIWQGADVQRPRCVPRVDFLSLLAAEPGEDGEVGDDGDGGEAAAQGQQQQQQRWQSRRYTLRTFPIGNGNGGNGGGDSGDGGGGGSTPDGLRPSLDADCVPTDEDMGNAGGAAEGADGGARGEADEDEDDDDVAGGIAGDNAGGDDGDNNNDVCGSAASAMRPAATAAAAAAATARPATDHNRSRMMSVPRAFAEWKMAAAVVDCELAGGDILVLDGTLQTGYGGEARLADSLYGAARRRGVIVCALAKTTTLMGPGGVPVLYAAQEAARAAGHQAWHMPLARRVPGDGSGFVLAVRLHRHSRFTYRLEVLRDQYDLLQGSGEIGGVIGSIAANSGDPSFPGYPYGLISADRYARVRGAEAAVHRRIMLAELGRHDMGRTMVEHTLLLSAHQTLNRAVGG